MKSNNGIAIVTALLIMVVVGLLATGGALVTRMELNIARNDASSLQAHYAAQAGLQKYKTMLFQYFRYLETLPPGENPERTACFDRMGSGMDLDRDGTEEHVWSGGTITFAEEEVKNSDGEVIGTYAVTIHRDSKNNHQFTITSRGKSNGARATVRSTLLVENTGVLENAIFTGQGQMNEYLNGGVTIRGGVYVVGTEDDPNTSIDESNNTVVGANGNFSMLNDYDLTNGNYEAMRYRVSSGNRTAANLCSSLRVDNGRVELNGSVKLGDPANWLLGVYVGDEPDDLIVNETLEQCTDNKGICSEIGRFTLDLTEGGAPEFPELTNAPDPDSDCTASTWSGCIFDEAMGNGLAITREVLSDGTPVVYFDNPSAPGTLSPGCETFLESSLLSFSNTAVDCTYEDPTGVWHGFRYGTGNGWSTAKLEVFGTVSLQGYDVKFDWPTDYIAKTMNSATDVDWNASFAVEANDGGAGGGIDINQNLLTSSADANHLFPNHVLGLVAEGNVYQRAANVMAPIYAGETFRIIKGNKLLGSVVSNMFCTTSAGDSNDCNAGQNAEVIYVNTGHNKPKIMQYVDSAGIPLFKVLSYERR